jgi:hypothetical protein
MTTHPHRMELRGVLLWAWALATALWVAIVAAWLRPYMSGAGPLNLLQISLLGAASALLPPVLALWIGQAVARRMRPAALPALANRTG